jgi:hypothetical protein
MWIGGSLLPLVSNDQISILQAWPPHPRIYDRGVSKQKLNGENIQEEQSISCDTLAIH